MQAALSSKVAIARRPVGIKPQQVRSGPNYAGRSSSTALQPRRRNAQATSAGSRRPSRGTSSLAHPVVDTARGRSRLLRQQRSGVSLSPLGRRGIDSCMPTRPACLLPPQARSSMKLAAHAATYKVTLQVREQ